MRPVRRGSCPLGAEFSPYTKAKPYLANRLGLHCSFCERAIPTGLAIEHIQAKSIAKYSHLAGSWTNFLFGCVNCNSSKGTTDVDFDQYYMPDRDNTFLAFTYLEDGSISPRAELLPIEKAIAARTLKLVGLDKARTTSDDDNERAVALDRAGQRKEAFAKALEVRAKLQDQPGNVGLRELAIDVATTTGFFSVWMAVFAADNDMRKRLVAAHRGTTESGCFSGDPLTEITPHPNADGLAGGGKL